MRAYLLAVLFCLSQTAWGQTGETRERRASTGQEKKWGTYVAIGNPYPTLLGINAAYNIDNNLRASIGYGEVEVTTAVGFDSNGFTEQKIKGQTYSAGMDYLFLQSSFRPVLGARAGYFSVNGNGSFELQGISKSTALIYSNVGVDWLTSGGFNLGTGVNVALLGGHGANFYANIGYFF